MRGRRMWFAMYNGVMWFFLTLLALWNLTNMGIGGILLLSGYAYIAGIYVTMMIPRKKCHIRFEDRTKHRA